MIAATGPENWKPKFSTASRRIGASRAVQTAAEQENQNGEVQKTDTGKLVASLTFGRGDGAAGTGTPATALRWDGRAQPLRMCSSNRPVRFFPGGGAMTTTRTEQQRLDLLELDAKQESFDLTLDLISSLDRRELGAVGRATVVANLLAHLIQRDGPDAACKIAGEVLP
ncbi:MAG: hypothetical protein QGH33_02625 [Pirellulaceae bacterium]|nr:hypothetical protein [Pirellulaceae bacterium]